MRNWFIVHFQTLEKYPPVNNFIRFVSSQPDYENNLHVITVHPGKGKTAVEFPNVATHRIATIKERNRFSRLFFYIYFNVKALLLLIKHKPASILYYETLSAFPALWYKKWINPKVRLFIHYHEYTSPEDYASGMVISRLLHKSERKLYEKATWVSHTNATRMAFFLKDIGKQRGINTAILPNYPPAQWIQSAASVKRADDKRIGFVYVGALGMTSMYTREMAEFVANHSDKCYWHIYSDNHEKEAREYLARLNAPNIVFKGGVKYDDLPLVLAQYDIGVIIYKGVSLNHIYSEPNKFFEYLVCGLNVWYPEEIKGMHGFEQSKIRPWVRQVNFTDLQFPECADGYRKEQIQEQPYTADSVYEKLWKKLNQKN
jgi:glycosyltransferase involved in cell wall biosynthesis